MVRGESRSIKKPYHKNRLPYHRAACTVINIIGITICLGFKSLLNSFFRNSDITSIYSGRNIVKTLLSEYLKILNIINIDRIVPKNLLYFLLLNIFIIDSSTILVRPIPVGEYKILFVFILGSNNSFRLTITSCVEGLSMLRSIVGIMIILEHSNDNRIGPTIDIVLDIIVFNVGLFILCKYLYIEYIIITIILSSEYFKLVSILKNKDIISK
jgi:hypothetical protein